MVVLSSPPPPLLQVCLANCLVSTSFPFLTHSSTSTVLFALYPPDPSLQMLRIAFLVVVQSLPPVLHLIHSNFQPPASQTSLHRQLNSVYRTPSQPTVTIELLSLCVSTLFHTLYPRLYVYAYSFSFSFSCFPSFFSVDTNEWIWEYWIHL